MIKQTYDGRKIPIYSVKDSQKFKEIQTRLLFKLCETSITWRMVENVCNIVVLLIAADWFSPIVASNVAYILFLSIVVQILCPKFL